MMEWAVPAPGPKFSERNCEGHSILLGSICFRAQEIEEEARKVEGGLWTPISTIQLALRQVLTPLTLGKSLRINTFPACGRSWASEEVTSTACQLTPGCAALRLFPGRNFSIVKKKLELRI